MMHWPSSCLFLQPSSAVRDELETAESDPDSPATVAVARMLSQAMGGTLPKLIVEPTATQPQAPGLSRARWSMRSKWCSLGPAKTIRSFTYSTWQERPIACDRNHNKEIT